MERLLALEIAHHTVFDSKWELSTERVTTLARIFIVHTHIAPVRISAAGFAEFHPVASNATEAGRPRNRRVDIIVLPNNFHHARAVQAKTVSFPPSISDRRINKNSATLHKAEAVPPQTAAREFAPILKVLRSSSPPMEQPHEVAVER